MKKCADCGQDKPLQEFAPNGRGGIRTVCRPCNYARRMNRYPDKVKTATDKYRESNRDRTRRTQYESRRGERWWSWSIGKILQSAKKRSSDRGIDFDLDKEFLVSLWFKQGGRCALSEVPFERTPVLGSAHIFSPSLDRVDQKKGYTKGNVRWLLHGINSLRGMGTDEDVMAICEAVVNRRSGNGQDIAEHQTGP